MRTIVATGAGAPCFFDNMDFMNQHGLTIYMQLSPEILCQRLTHARVVRPLIQGKTESELLLFITSKLSERERFYKQAQMIADGAEMALDDYVRLVEESTQPF